MDRRSPLPPAGSRAVLHLVDSLGLGGTQSILKDYFESRRQELAWHLYGLRTVPKQTQVAHPNVHVHPSPRRFSLAPLFSLRRMVREQGITVLHCHLFRAQAFGYLIKALFFPRLTLIFHEHGRVVGREGEPVLEALVFQAFLRLAWRRVDCFICNSELTSHSLRLMIPDAAGRVTVMSNPIPVHPDRSPRFDTAALRRELEVPDGAFVVGFASRLVERKGWRDFLEALTRIDPRVPLYFLVAGDGEDRELAVAYVHEHGLAAKGRLLGRIAWMGRFYQALDCFVMPSHWEPHGLAHLEAQAFSVPVIVSDVPGLGGTVHAERDALLCAPGDPAALAHCIERVARDPSLRARLVAAGLENASRFTMEAFAARLDEIYANRREAIGETS